LFNLTPNLNRL